MKIRVERKHIVIFFICLLVFFQIASCQAESRRNITLDDSQQECGLTYNPGNKISESGCIKGIHNSDKHEVFILLDNLIKQPPISCSDIDKSGRREQIVSRLLSMFLIYFVFFLFYDLHKESYYSLRQFFSASERLVYNFQDKDGKKHISVNTGIY